MNDAGNSVHYGFERNRNLLFDLLSRNSRPLSDDLNVIVGDIGVGLDGEIVERDDAPGEQQYGKREDEHAVAESEIDDAANHFGKTN